MTEPRPDSPALPASDAAELRARLTRTAVRLRGLGTPADPVLWAAASALDTAVLLLAGHAEPADRGPAARRAALLEALGSARAAVGAVTHALRETAGNR
ncbi:hypothetical protein [Amycolatopsis sp. GA6-003]|uniref:hypothetical protein n=1 Tax=Amycolatopsis sp. GA6-003 TaxID=2652444 RepID=UPI003916DE48